jgi:hypothetical protein
MAEEYSRTVPFTGKTARALDVARTIFMAHGFEIVASNDHELRVTGPGITNTKENPLRGVSEASMIVSARAIEIQARLGGTRLLKRLLWILPLGLALLFLIAFGVTAWIVPDFRRAWIFLIPALALAPWLILSPLMIRKIENRTIQAVDTLLNNMVIVGKSG